MAHEEIRDPLAAPAKPTAPEVAPIPAAPAAPAPAAPAAPAPAPERPNALRPTGAQEFELTPEELALVQAKRQEAVAGPGGVEEFMTPKERNAAALKKTEVPDPTIGQHVMGAGRGVLHGAAKVPALAIGLLPDLANMVSDLIGDPLFEGSITQTLLNAGKTAAEGLPEIAGSPEESEFLRMMTWEPVIENMTELGLFSAVIPGGFGAAARGTALVAGKANRVGRFMERRADAVLNNLGAHARLEGGIGATAGLAGGLYQKAYPNERIGKMVAEIGTGLGVSVARTLVPAAHKLPVPKVIIRTWRRFRKLESESDIERLAASTIQDLQARGQIAPGSFAGEGFPAPGSASGADIASADVLAAQGVSPAVATGNVELMAIEKAARKEFPSLGRHMDENAEAFQRVWRETVEELGGQGGVINVQKAEDAIKARSVYMLNWVREITMSRVQKVADRLGKMKGSAASISVRNQRIRKVLDKSAKEGQDASNAEWAKHDMAPDVPTPELFRVMEEIIHDTPNIRDLAQIIPQRLLRKIGKVEKIDELDTFVIGEMAQNSTLGDVNEIRKMINEAMTLNLNPKGITNTSLRRMNQLKTALLDDADNFAKATGQTSLRETVAFTRAIKEMFNEGPIATARGLPTNTAAVDAEMVFGQMIAPGTGSLIGTDGVRIMKKMVDAAGDRASEMKSTLLESTRHTLAVAFSKFDEASGTHKLDVPAMKNWMAKNELTLDFFPTLKAELGSVETAQRLVNQAAKMEGSVLKSLTARNRMKAATTLSTHDGGTIGAMLAGPMPATNAAKQLRIVKQFGGKSAVAGYRTEYLLSIMARSASGKSGARVPDGRSMEGILLDEANVARQVFAGDAGALEAFREMVKGWRTVERSGLLSGTGTIEDMMGVNALTQIIARVAGARLGAKLGGRGGASIQSASIGAKFLSRFVSSLGQDRLKEILIAATFDQKLMSRLRTMPATKTGFDIVTNQMQAWLVAVGGQLNQEGLSEDEDREEGSVARAMRSNTDIAEFLRIRDAQ